MNKIKTALSIVACCAACVGGLHGQGTFANFDFELAGSTLPSSVTNIAPPNPVSADQAFPGWWVYYGSSLQPIASYNTFFLTTASVSLQGPGRWQSFNIEGSYAALLQPGIDPSTGDPSNLINVSLAQVGQVPYAPQFIQMKVLSSPANGFQVSFGGQEITMLPIEMTPNYTLYAGDMTAYASQIGELRITALAGDRLSPNWTVFDSIRFGPIPEPSSAVLVATGLAVIALLRTWKRVRT